MLLLLALPAALSAQFNYITVDDTITITGYTGPGGAVVIPATVNGLPVTRIGEQAFFGKSGMTSLTIPKSVGSIGERAFYGCTGLTGITVDPLNSSFVGLEGVLFDKGLTLLRQYPEGKAGSYMIPHGVTTIGADAFADCTGLTGLYFRGQPPALGVGSNLFLGSERVTVYYLPGATQWGPAFGRRPTALWLPRVRTDDASFGVRNNQFEFDVSWAAGQSVVVEMATGLANLVWSPLQTLTLTGDSIRFTDPDWMLQPTRFYRLRTP